MSDAVEERCEVEAVVGVDPIPEARMAVVMAVARIDGSSEGTEPATAAAILTALRGAVEAGV